MDFLEALRAALCAADDDYLIGLTNKGTVNRAKKDLSALKNVSAQTEKDGVRVTLGDVRCLIRSPIGRSECSCPSSSLCRHRIAAVLWLRDQLNAQPVEESKASFDMLRDYPVEKLIRHLGSRRVSSCLRRFREGKGPQITETSVISVEIPWIPATVRLLEPLEDSTCSCHSKNWCAHKSEALFFWLLDQKIVNPSDICPEEEINWDVQAVGEVCRDVCLELQSLMASGLNRMDPGIRETLERLESRCHTVKLANLERSLRGLRGELNAYFFRSATFRDTALMRKIAGSYHLAALLGRAGQAEISELAGKFREEYDAVGDLKLYLLGIRRLSGHGGYMGTVYYFRHREENRYYTFRHIRSKSSAEAGRRMGDPSPWNLPCTLNQAWNQAIDISSARVNREGNLSSSEQCEAVLVGKMEPWDLIPESDLVTDFLALLDQMGDMAGNEREFLALIRPRECIRQPFDPVRQVYSMILKDASGRDIRLEIQYSREEAHVVDMMDTLERNMGAFPVPPVFFGRVYRDGDMLKLYPIEYFQNWRGKA